MSDLIQHLALGFGEALSLVNLFYAFIGCLLGTLIGVLPGIGPVATISMLLPATFALPPTSALIMLAGIFYGAQYGGSTTAILVNLPGESSSIVTALDGYQMARRGRGGTALATAALGSFFAGTVGVLLLAAFATPMARLALQFGPAEYFALMVFGLVGAVVLAHGSVVKAVAMVLLGVLLGLVGTDVQSGLERYTFGRIELNDGLSFIAIAMGVFGYGEIIRNLSQPPDTRQVHGSTQGLMPSAADLRAMAPAMLRGTAVGSLLGVLPGGGATLAAFTSYTVEKRLRLRPGEVPMGEGNIRGVAGPESANNAGAQTSFIPLLTMGIPSNAVMAMMVGAMMIHNIQPGPQILTQSPTLFWGLVASMWIGNLMLLVLNLPLVGLWVRLVAIPYHFLFPAITLFCALGVYSTSSSTWDIWVVGAFGLLGWLLHKLDLEPAPMMLGIILGPLMEENLRRAMQLAGGEWGTFVQRPISAAFLAAAALLLVTVLLPIVRRKRDEAFADED